LVFRSTAIISLLFAVSAAQAVTVLPGVGYSTSTGFVIGGIASQTLLDTEGDEAGSITLKASYGTAGLVSFGPEFTYDTGSGIWEASARYMRLMEKKWYGWGNGTDPGYFTLMDFEKQNIEVSYSPKLIGNLYLRTGLDFRHSTVYNREDSPLWAENRSDRYSSTWTAGGSLGLTYRIGIPLGSMLVTEFVAEAQTGDVDYSSLEGSINTGFLLPAGAQLSVETILHRHFNIEETPLPYTSYVGQGHRFRGYSDFRFTGPVWGLASMEIQKLFTEIRVPVINESWGIGLSVFADAGQVAEEVSGLRMDRFHTDVGFGVRLLTHDKMLLKGDLAWGDEGVVISGGIDQAF